MTLSLSERLKQFTTTPEYQTNARHYKRMTLLAEKIYGRRKDLSLTQTQLALRAATTQRIISELEDATYAPQKGIGEELYDKLAVALEIDRDYLFSDKIDRRTFELFAYLCQRLGTKGDMIQFAKVLYFVDLKAVEEFCMQMTNFTYRRSDHGPFDQKIYLYKMLFEENQKVHYTFLREYIELIDRALEQLPIKNAAKLKKLIYETLPHYRLSHQFPPSA